MVTLILVGIGSLIVGALGTWFFIRRDMETIERELMERFIAGIKDGTFDVAPIVPRSFIKFSRLPKPTVQDLIDELMRDEEWKERAKVFIENGSHTGPTFINIGSFDPSVYRHADSDLFHAYDAHEAKYGTRHWRVPEPSEDDATPLLRPLTPEEREMGKVYNLRYGNE